MKTLIVPCCGKLSYNETPVYLIDNPQGQILLASALKGISLKSFNRIVVVIPSSHNELWQAEKKIRQAIKHSNLQIVQLDHDTNGPANTVFEAINKLSIEGEVVIKDADNSVIYNDSVEGNFVIGIDIYDYAGEIRNLKNKSFLVSNEQNQLIDVVEKRICSSQVCLGVYGFADAKDFVLAVQALNDPIYGLKDIYVSEAITYLMGFKGELFKYIVAEDYHNWGNQYDLQDMMRMEDN